MAILLLGEANEVHMTAVRDALKKRGRAHVCFDVWSSWLPATLQIEAGAAHVEQGGARLPVSAVWNRLKPRLKDSLSEAFAVRERREFLMGWVTLSGCTRLMNDPVRQERSRNKPFQLVAAHRAGLRTPRTWISNDATLMARNAGEHERGLIYKPLSWLISLDGRLLYTNAVTAAQLLDGREAIQCAPGIYQELVPKRCEYRVTVVGDRVFTARIYSQERTDTVIDWRRNQFDVRYETCTLPAATEAAVRTVVSDLGLEYAALDLIETPDGEHVFLEANPAGNWLWLEERLGIGISSAIAEYLGADEPAPAATS